MIARCQTFLLAIAFALLGGTTLAWFSAPGLSNSQLDEAIDEVVSVKAIQSDGVRYSYPTGREPSYSIATNRHEVIRSVLKMPLRMNYGDFKWNENGVPDGQVWVRVDLRQQLISVFRAGHEIGTAVILYGSDGTPTPTGSFPVLEKRADYHSRKYDAPMPHMMRLTWDGVALHASQIRRGSATHGCIGTPPAFARLLFEAVSVGDPVLVESGYTVGKN